MDDDKFERYLQDRYAAQIAWYDDRSGLNKRCYVFFQWAVIILSALIPVMTVSSPGEAFKFYTAGLGVLLAIGTAGLKSFKFEENWINYRTVAEMLKKERHYLDAGIDSYADAADPRSLFVERVEALISRENSLWVTVQRKKDAEGGGRGAAR